MYDVYDRLQILADSAKYDVSCSSSGNERKNNRAGGIGNARSFGICHAWAADGRCISLLKILMTNHCVYDCAYCINRSSNDVPRASLTPEEIAKTTMAFYRRNYIEGLFLSSAVDVSPNQTMEQIVKTLELLRHQWQFQGYIHVKAIPGADPRLIQQAGFLADRMSANIELPSSESLQRLAPQKQLQTILKPMNQIQHGIEENRYALKQYRNAQSFVPAGQSTQMIVGATPESDYQMIHTSQKLYDRFQLKRVFYSAYIPVGNPKKILVPIPKIAPLMREHRLYQADWLLRFYGFRAEELLDEIKPHFDADFDPKMIWAIRHLEQFPVEINRAPFETLIRVPGIGHKTASRIVNQRRLASLSVEEVKKTRLVWKRARFFLTVRGKYYGGRSISPEGIKTALQPEWSHQLRLFPNAKGGQARGLSI
ncbi:putative DNA modification/repair radical SAM protein [Gottschalkiaceae bacterium SANA]|nr:putative DNA modification/repair radical SAM protein [Gottschalkiaceae bacterium SANA]